MGGILLIATDWQFRALVRAQLLEEGYEVQALPSVEAALVGLSHGEGQPCLTILDMQELNVQAGMVSDLWRLCGEGPLILCGGALDRAVLCQEHMPPARVLLRPLRVGDLVREVRRMGA